MVVKVSTTTDINKAIKKQAARSKTVKITGLNGQHSIAVGLSIEKQLSFEGSVGDFFGALNNGSILSLKGNARRFLGDTMTSGGIILQGDTHRGVGIAMSGGIIVIRGDVNGDVGQLIKGGTIIVSGNTGPRTGAFMINGELIISGNVGKEIGHYMVGGVIFVGGRINNLGKNSQIRELNDSDKNKLNKYFKHYGITKNIDNFKKIVPKNKNPFENKIFDFENLLKAKRLEDVNFLNEITKKTNNSLIRFFGLTKEKLKTPIDRLAIIPAQVQPIKELDIIEPNFETKVVIGINLEKPLILSIPFYLSSRGSGIVSGSSKMAFIYAAGKNKTAVDTGGATFNEEYELNTKYNSQLIHQWNTARLGINKDYLLRGNAIEIVLGAGGWGSLPPVIPSKKIIPELGKNWNININSDIINPPKMFDMDVSADLKRHVELLREITENKVPILLKIAAGNVYEDTKLAIRAGVDAIVIEGFDILYQNIPEISTKNLGFNSIHSIPPAVKAMKDLRADNRGIKLIISGLFKNGADVFKAIALGADAVVINAPAEIAIGCDLCGNCNDNKCPKGIATTNPKLESKLDWVKAGQKLDNYLKTIMRELKLLMLLARLKSINEININSVIALDYETAAATGIKLVGYDKSLPMWEH